MPATSPARTTSPPAWSSSVDRTRTRLGDQTAQCRAEVVQRLHARGERTWLPIHDTGSMWPLLGRDTEVLISWGAWPRRVGDLVLVRGLSGDVTVVHRVAALATECLWETPDSFEESYDWAIRVVAGHEVFGVVAAIRDITDGRVVYLDRIAARAVARLQVSATRALTCDLAAGRRSWARRTHRTLLRFTSMILWRLLARQSR